MPQINKTISQITIGNSTYNIKDAEVREILGNVTDNFIALALDQYEDWHASKYLYGDQENELKNKTPAAILVYRLATGVSLSTHGRLRWRHAQYENDGNIDWIPTPVEAGMPEQINQCGIIIQYRTRIRMYMRGQFSTAIYRLDTSNNDMTNIDSSFDPSQEVGCKEMPGTKHTSSKVLDGNEIIECSTSWFDRIVRSDSGRSGYDYKPGMSNYVQAGSITTANRAKTAGGAIRILFIAQGTSTKALIPVEDEIIDNPPPSDDEGESETENDGPNT